jgi:putative transposase
MRTSKFTEAQKVDVLRQVDAGTPVVEVCRKLGVSEATFFRWRKQIGDLGTTELKELRQLRGEVRRLKALVADLSLDKRILQESMKRKW